MKRQMNRLILLMLIWVVASACASQTEPVTEIPVSTPTTGKTELPPPIDVCEPLDVPGVVFPRQEYVEGPREMMAAELIGKLELVVFL